MEINTVFKIIPKALQLTEEKAPTSILSDLSKNVFDFSNSYVARYFAIQEDPNQRKHR